jgi:signal transduction histidine kinase
MAEHPPTKTPARLLIPFLVLAVSLVITVAMAAYVSLTAAAKDRARFENITQRAQAAIQTRLETYVNLLRGVAGLYAAMERKVTLQHFQAYVERLNLTERYPGIQGIGVSGMVVGGDFAGLRETMQKQGVPNFEIYPGGPREQYHAILFLEPQDERNRRAIGYDMFTEPTRRAAMELARDSGNAAASGKVSLVQELDEQKQAGFLIYVPVYVIPVTPSTLEQRRQAIGGYIFSPFRVDDLLQGIFGSERSPSGISFSVFDGDSTSSDALLHRSDKTPESIEEARFATTENLSIPGRQWTVAYSSGPQFETNSSRGFAIGVLAAGGLVSVLLFSLTAAQASAQRRAEQAAHDLRLGEQEILAARDEAQRALAIAKKAAELKDEFLATVSHELRTPLNSILGWSHILSTSRTHDPDELRHGLETIQRNAKAQTLLIDDLLDVSRIVTGNLRMDVRAVPLGPVVEGAISSVKLAADSKGVTLHLAMDPNIGAVNGDETRLQQIVWNLLSNAVKFTPAGGWVKVTVKHERSHAHITVADTGIGISKDFLPHVFERFRQADASTTRHYGGLGLGLGIVRHLTELHGGTVHAESPGENQGATFTVILPEAAIASPEPRPRSAPVPSNGPSLQGVHVLLVEDDPSAQEFVTRMLRNRGASVASQSSVASAIVAFQERRPEVIVSDIGMPAEDGYSLIQRIRALPANAGGFTPAIALTAQARPEDRQRALSAGFQMHFAKPFDPNELIAAIATFKR